jgi:hypothetical protein
VARGNVVRAGVPAGHRFCADAVVGYGGQRTPGGCLGSSGNPPREVTALRGPAAGQQRHPGYGSVAALSLGGDNETGDLCFRRKVFE